MYKLKIMLSNYVLVFHSLLLLGINRISINKLNLVSRQVVQLLKDLQNYLLANILQSINAMGIKFIRMIQFGFTN